MTLIYALLRRELHANSTIRMLGDTCAFSLYSSRAVKIGHCLEAINCSCKAEAVLSTLSQYKSQAEENYSGTGSARCTDPEQIMCEILSANSADLAVELGS